ncbi:MAG: MDR family MFS transporter [Methanomethylophilus sp.]|jgi:EmrB/QacA subfamily drug resistance transporter
MAVEQITYKNIDPKVRTAIMVGICLAMLIACFDGTIVGTCGPKIAEDLDGLELYSWLATAYMLFETIFIPIAGKLSDLYGRKPLFLIGLTIFVIGSFIAGASTSMTMLIACRAFQGIGGGILIPVATAAVADLYPPAKRAKMQGMLGAIFGIGSGVGPVLGGYIEEYFGWRWVFYINIPLALVSYFLTIKKFPTPDEISKPVIDTKGIVLLSVALGDLVLFFNFVGDDFGWVSTESFVMLGVFLVLIALFVLVEQKAQEPLLAPHLIHNKVVVESAVFMLIFGLAMMGAEMYSSMFAIYVLGLSTLEAGEYSIIMVIGMMITSITSGNTVNKTGYRFWLITGIVITVIGMYMFSELTLGSELSYYAECLFVLGFGLGCMMSVIQVAVQNASKPSEIGMTTSATNLFRGIGTTIGTAVFAMIIGNRIDEELQANVSETVYNSIEHDTGCLQDLANAIADGNMTIISEANQILLSFANSVNYAFICAAGIVACLIVIAVIYKAPTYTGNEVGDEATAQVMSDIEKYHKHGIIPEAFREEAKRAAEAKNASGTEHASEEGKTPEPGKDGKKRRFGRRKE